MSQAASANGGIAHAAVGLRGQTGEVVDGSLVGDGAVTSLLESSIDSAVSASASSLRDLRGIARKSRNQSGSLLSVEAALVSGGSGVQA